MNKRGDEATGVPMALIVAIIILLIFLFVMLAAYYKMPWIFDKMGAYFDSVLIMIGMKNAGSVGGSSTNDCMEQPASFTLNNGFVDDVKFELCFKWNQKRCRIYDFDDKTEYWYIADTGNFTKKLNDTGTFPVDMDKEYTDADYENEIFYNGVKFVYDSFNVPEKSGRVSRYDMHNYLKHNIDDYFGEYGDLLVFYGSSSRHYFMAANGRYLIIDLNKMEDNGLSWVDEWFVDFEKDVNYRLITPINGIFMDEKDGVVYAGNNPNRAMTLFYEQADSWFSDDIITYSLCSPVDSNAVYENCKYTRKAEDVVSSGSLLKFKQRAVANVGGSIGSHTSQLDNDVDYKLIKNYVEKLQNTASEGGTSFPNPATQFNNLVSSKNTFEVKDKTFIVEARASEDPNFRYPVLRIRSENNQEIYYLRFEGQKQYSEGNLEFFFSHGNQIRPPFLFYDKDMNPIEVSREFTQSEDENALDRQVYDYLMERCA